MSLFFKNRDGHTPLPSEMRDELKLKHIADMTELYEQELENIALGILWSLSTSKDHLNYQTWIDLHLNMFHQVWKFAGKIRIVELANPEFLQPFQIRPVLLELERDVHYWLKHQTYDEKELLVQFHLRLLTIHPFKDGNGRWSRVLTEMIARRENFKIPTWGLEIKDDDRRREHYIKSIKKALHDFDTANLKRFMFS